MVAERFGPDQDVLAGAVARWRDERGPASLARLGKAVEPPRQELFRRMNLAPHGTAMLVRLRAALLAELAGNPGLKPVDDDLKHLFLSWFNRGFLELRRISWETPAAILEKLIAYEAVHAITGWDDLRRRLALDRRCFAFFHPALPDEPLIFVEVALLDAMPGRIEPIIQAGFPETGPAAPSNAIFYSISNCQTGLRGISFGNFLIKQVAADLTTEFPSLRTFATLSPIPGFRAWVEAPDMDLTTALPAALARQIAAAGDEATLQVALLEAAGRPDTATPVEREALLRLSLHYLAGIGVERGQSDPVARFHLGNGARIERVNWAGDSSSKGRSESFGLMVNYLYDLARVEQNHEAFVNRKLVATSADLADWLDGAPQRPPARLGVRRAISLLGLRL